ncbi:CBS domain-containing protein [Anaeromyxobacter oryzae]|uniref:CBS domain-containing protein n=1 Tax=Anaeromyxobacter oryzae TaxID=2918170 RepID=A0ABN6MPI9_9BACT|nr:CBS domain-containing protein [Anaeromyxobacter oryzae]BDG02903.1 CBS domain-containing protein [Anaeromyxobacter oryzae]
MKVKVQELMTRAVWTCRADDPMSVAARVMWEHDIGAVPVLGADEKIVGIVTDRDLCMSAYFTGEPLAAIPVEHAMSKVVFTIEPAHTVGEAEQLMRSKRVRRLPVVDAGKLVGMITLGDLARAAHTHKAVAASDVNAAFAAVVEPRRAPEAAAA